MLQNYHLTYVIRVYTVAFAGLLRCSKSCRLRWTNYLRPGIKHGNFMVQEEKMIIPPPSPSRQQVVNTKGPDRSDTFSYVLAVWPMESDELAAIRVGPI